MKISDDDDDDFEDKEDLEDLDSEDDDQMMILKKMKIEVIQLIP